MRCSVIIPIFNEEGNLPALIDALSAQTRRPDDICFVDDGSSDRSLEILSQASLRHERIRVLTQTNRGPAAARNRGWKSSTADVCVFTDGDCIPNADWLERLLSRFDTANTAAVGGMYRTLNASSSLARFIGREIDQRYQSAGRTVDAHGTYNLAVRREVLEELGGFDERYKLPSGEDWDLTYKISSRYEIKLARDAIVGHFHPEILSAYLRNQMIRGADRVRLYLHHPDKMMGDDYTGRIEKYAVLSSTLSIMAIAAMLMGLPGSGWLLTGSLSVVFLYAALGSFMDGFKATAVAFGFSVRIVRLYAWTLGMFEGIFRCLKRKPFSA